MPSKRCIVVFGASIQCHVNHMSDMTSDAQNQNNPTHIFLWAVTMITHKPVQQRKSDHSWSTTEVSHPCTGGLRLRRPASSDTGRSLPRSGCTVSLRLNSVVRRGRRRDTTGAPASFSPQGSCRRSQRGRCLPGNGREVKTISHTHELS